MLNVFTDINEVSEFRVKGVEQLISSQAHFST
jgi:hypothetical protein